jgi:NADH ubiquinone oxidoreductase, 20 Kd subunit/Prokaryotic cytochrome b561
VLLDRLSLDYTETLQAAAGHQAEKCLQDTIKNAAGKYILLVEGSVPMNDGGVYCTIAGRTAEDILQEAARDAAAVIAWGSCASNGCIQAAKPNPTGATPVHKLIGKPVVNVPGCPPIADVMTGVVTHLLVFGSLPELDSIGRPKEFYSRRVYVWQLPVRFYHWLNAFCVAVLCATGFLIGHPTAMTYSSEAYQQYWFGTVRFLHFSAAFIFFFNYLFRVYWGFAGAEACRVASRRDMDSRVRWPALARHSALLVAAARWAIRESAACAAPFPSRGNIAAPLHRTGT